MEVDNQTKYKTDDRVQLSIELPTFTFEQRELKIRQLLTQNVSHLLLGKEVNDNR